MTNIWNHLFKNFALKEKIILSKYSVLKRRYSKITCVNINNWNNEHKDIIRKIREGDFISLDVEYTGLHLKDERYISIDSSYEAHCDGAKSFFPCQIGITIAKKKDKQNNNNNQEESLNNNKNKKGIDSIQVVKSNERNKKPIIEGNSNVDQEWDISPYCIYVFPKENKYFSVSTSTLLFLKENNFDFNEWIINGIGYLRPNEEEEKKKDILQKINELNNILNSSNKTYSDKNNGMNNNEKQVDINKIVNEIEHNKVVYDEDKDIIIDIIKKIGIWLNKSENKLNCSGIVDGTSFETTNVQPQMNKKQVQISNTISDEKKNDIFNKNMYTQHKNKIEDGSLCDNKSNNTYTNKNDNKNSIFQNSDNLYDLLSGNTKRHNNIYSKNEHFLTNNNSVNSTSCNNNNLLIDKTKTTNNISVLKKESFSKHNEMIEHQKMHNNIITNNSFDDCPLYIEIENPYVRLLAHTIITKYFNNIFCMSVKVNDKKHLAIYKSEKDSYKEQIRTYELEIEKINKTVGVRLLFDEIIKNKKIIVGHNCFYDILHIYQTFYNELPNSIGVFKKKWTQLFPYTFDTKYMNETNEYLYALNGPATLKGLCEYMASLISSTNDFGFVLNFMNGNNIDVPHCLVPFVHNNNGVSFFTECHEKDAHVKNGYVGQEEVTRAYALNGTSSDSRNSSNDSRNSSNDSRNSSNDNLNDTRLINNNDTCIKSSNDNNVAQTSDEHNAGYDSLLTCLLFIFQCHYILKNNNKHWRNIYFDKETDVINNNNNNNNSFFSFFLNMCNKIKIVKTQPNVVSLTSQENHEMERHFYMYDYPSYFKKWEIMKIWSPIWISLSKVNDQACWIIAKSDEDARNIKMIYKMLQNPQFKLCTYEEYLTRFKCE
ncbi:poly(A)-specific ribonuclease PARN, putative [Hepatocystis sp. ex Piliocolobus tephrosceles]|nr:poly(A)-specific ribonuclease PARN, putative [Hepatocystis sp. ex Piliocolobus tephrosceles]VWU52059.1 poly(A)-specific ribonuclease PARN, putative [Hepatocystis sp. ex Piliocolobus tephrosceles]